MRPPSDALRRKRVDNAAAAHALAIYLSALDAVRADRLVLSAVGREGDTLRMDGQAFPLGGYERVYVVGAGKAATGMAQAIEKRLGDHLTEGVVVTKYGHGGPTRKIRVLEAGHPIPDEGSVAAGRAIHALAQRAGERDLVLVLISGGASALMELPHEGITLDDLRVTTDLLLRAGATIDELNAVRACLSQLKAGGLARAAHPATVVCLVLSDVLGNPLHVIGSGPCVDTPIDPRAAEEITARYAVQDKIPARVLEFLSHLRPSPLHPVTLSPLHVIVGDIWTALEAARNAALERGLRPCALTGSVRGEAREVAQVFAGIARDLPRTCQKTGVDCYIAGGETTVTVRGRGTGGRSQEIACAAVPILDGVEGVALLAAGTDGTDGPTDAAGGLVTGETMAKARAAGLRVEAALRENDAYPFLQAVDALLLTGPTHSNVGDLVLMTWSGAAGRIDGQEETASCADCGTGRR